MLIKGLSAALQTADHTTQVAWDWDSTISIYAHEKKPLSTLMDPITERFNQQFSQPFYPAYKKERFKGGIIQFPRPMSLRTKVCQLDESFEDRDKYARTMALTRRLSRMTFWGRDCALKMCAVIYDAAKEIADEYKTKNKEQCYLERLSISVPEEEFYKSKLGSLEQQPPSKKNRIFAVANAIAAHLWARKLSDSNYNITDVLTNSSWLTDDINRFLQQYKIENPKLTTFMKQLTTRAWSFSEWRMLCKNFPSLIMVCIEVAPKSIINVKLMGYSAFDDYDSVTWIKQGTESSQNTLTLYIPDELMLGDDVSVTWPAKILERYQKNIKRFFSFGFNQLLLDGFLPRDCLSHVFSYHVLKAQYIRDALLYDLLSAYGKVDLSVTCYGNDLNLPIEIQTDWYLSVFETEYNKNFRTLDVNQANKFNTEHKPKGDLQLGYINYSANKQELSRWHRYHQLSPYLTCTSLWHPATLPEFTRGKRAHGTWEKVSDLIGKASLMRLSIWLLKQLLL